MKNIETIEKAASEKFGSFRRFCIETGQDHTNFKRKFRANLDKISDWLNPLGLEIQIHSKIKKHKKTDIIESADFNSELLIEWQSKYDKLYDELAPISGNYTNLDWQNDGRLIELNNCMVALKSALAKSLNEKSDLNMPCVNNRLGGELKQHN